jgi:hypothetical protein
LRKKPNATGECIGWHNLSEEEYQEKLKEYEENKAKNENLKNSPRLSSLVFIVVRHNLDI